MTTPSNVLPLHLVFSSSQNLNVDNILPDLDKIPPRPFKLFRTLIDEKDIKSLKLYGCQAAPIKVKLKTLKRLIYNIQF